VFGLAVGAIESIEPDEELRDQSLPWSQNKPCYPSSQSSSFNPLTRENSSVLCVTRMRFIARAIAAIVSRRNLWVSRPATMLPEPPHRAVQRRHQMERTRVVEGMSPVSHDSCAVASCSLRQNTALLYHGAYEH
jgi:hypothetical protein